MAAENVQTFTDGNFDETVLKAGGAGAGGFLGGVVRALQAAGPDGRRAGDRLRRQGHRRQAERRRQPEHRRCKFQIRGIPDAAAVQGRPGRRVRSSACADKDDLKKVIDKHL